jgi:hypothetical protein
MTPATRRLRLGALVAASVLVLAACGDDDDVTETGEPPSTTAAETTTTAEATSTTGASTTTVPAGLEQPAIWPAADVVFATPEEAAEDFVSTVLGVPPTLGEFQQGDARSGEIEVFSPGEGGGANVTRGLLLLRQLGPQSGWFVIAAVNENAAFTEPASGAEVPAGPLAVEGLARGFEANVVLTARVAGSDTDLDQVITAGGAFEDPEPFAESLDLSGAAPGDVVLLLVRGGTGLETDPGDFGAIPVVVR